MSLRPLILKKREERRILQGHPWVFSNEIDVKATPLTAFEPGEPVRLQAASGKLLGSAYVNPRTLISARLYAPGDEVELDATLIGVRLRQALEWRQRLLPEGCYRLVFGESDGLPGLVVDRFGGLLVAQLNTAGVERARDALLRALVEVVAPEAVVLRNDTGARETEGLARGVEVALGQPPELAELVENGARFAFSPLRGQKTGWFYDHRLNRARLAAYASGARVLDVFCYSGAWGVQAARAGAAEVLCLDASAEALTLVEENARRNQVARWVSTLRGDAFDSLRALADEGRRFDLVIADPPAFVKRKRDLQAGAEAYRRLNRLCLRLLEPGGVLFSASCSSHLDAAAFQRELWAAARAEGRALQLLERGHQGPDHPVHPALPETDYLKLIVARIAAAA